MMKENNTASTGPGPLPAGGIALPEDMPPQVLAMLQTTLTQIWTEYLRHGGNGNDAEAFWEFAVGGSRTWDVHALGVCGASFVYTVVAPSQSAALEKAYAAHGLKLRSGEVTEPLGPTSVALCVATSPKGGDTA